MEKVLKEILFVLYVKNLLKFFNIHTNDPVEGMQTLTKMMAAVDEIVKNLFQNGYEAQRILSVRYDTTVDLYEDPKKKIPWEFFLEIQNGKDTIFIFKFTGIFKAKTLLRILKLYNLSPLIHGKTLIEILEPIAARDIE